MANKSLQHSSLTDNIFYRSMLAGNDAFLPEFESDDFLEEVVLTSSATSVTFSGLGAYSDYKHLQIRLLARNNLATNYGSMKATFNNDSSSSYSWHRTRGTGSAVNSQAGINKAFMFASIQGAPSAANTFAPMVCDILDFSNSSKNTTVRILNGHTNEVTLFSGAYFKTDAITTINFSPDTGNNFVSGCRFSLYGSKG